MPAYLGLYPSFLVVFPYQARRPVAFYKQLAATTNNTGNFTSFFRYFIMGCPCTSLPPSSLYKSSLLELVRFCTAWEPFIASSFTPFSLFPPARA